MTLYLGLSFIGDSPSPRDIFLPEHLALRKKGLNIGSHPTPLPSFGDFCIGALHLLSFMTEKHETSVPLDAM